LQGGQFIAGAAHNLHPDGEARPRHPARHCQDRYAGECERPHKARRCPADALLTGLPLDSALADERGGDWRRREQDRFVAVEKSVEIFLEFPAQPLGVDVIHGADQMSLLDQNSDILAELLRLLAKQAMVDRCPICHLYEMRYLADFGAVRELNRLHESTGRCEFLRGTSDARFDVRTKRADERPTHHTQPPSLNRSPQ
jgi:hypothetical protein